MNTLKNTDKIVIATHNRHKAEEIRAVLRDLGPDLLTLDEFPHIGEIPETGSTLEENARIKAWAVFRATGLPALADDTGLEVDALNGKPGVYSARYAGENATYSDNVNKLLGELKHLDMSSRRARFRTVIACVIDGREIIAEGEVSGYIAHKPEGENGFGYDPVFWIPALKRTCAQLSDEEKNSVSHRGHALRNLRKLLGKQ